MPGLKPCLAGCEAVPVQAYGINYNCAKENCIKFVKNPANTFSLLVTVSKIRPHCAADVWAEFMAPEQNKKMFREKTYRRSMICLIMLPWRERQGRTKKLYRPRTHMGPGSASQHGECNPPAPRKVAGPFDRPTTPARYVAD